MLGILLSAWRYRFFIVTSIKTEFRAQFIRSRLGGLWMILQPLSQVLIIAFVLSAVMSAKLPGVTNKYAYSIYLMSGMLGWSLFTEILSRCTSLFIENGNLLKKVCFPKITLPLIVTGRALVNNVLLFAAILVIFGLLGHWPGITLIYLPVVTILMLLLALGLGLMLGVLNVFIRDIGQIVPIALQLLFWFTPIVYMIKIIPEKYAHLLKLNPLVPIIHAYQSILLFNQPPPWQSLGYVFILSLLLLGVSLVLFRKASPEMVDQL